MKNYFWFTSQLRKKRKKEILGVYIFVRNRTKSYTASLLYGQLQCALAFCWFEQNMLYSCTFHFVSSNTNKKNLKHILGYFTLENMALLWKNMAWYSSVFAVTQWFTDQTRWIYKYCTTLHANSTLSLRAHTKIFPSCASLPAVMIQENTQHPQ